MKLYHFSNNEIIGKLKTKHFGNNAYTQRDKDICNIKRIYFYTLKTPAEHCFKPCKYLYIAEVGKDKIYDLRADSERLCVKYNGDIVKIVQWVRKRGYIGLLYNIGYNVITVFENVDIVKTIERSV